MKNKIRYRLGGIGMEQKIWKSEGILRFKYRTSISYISFWKSWCVYLKYQEILQDFKNCSGDKFKLPKQESPAGIRRAGMSVIDLSYNLSKHSKLEVFENGLDWFVYIDTL